MCQGQGNGTPWAGEWNIIAEGTWEKVLTHRRGKVPLLGRGEEEGKAVIGNSLHRPTGLEGGVALWRLQAARSPLLV